MPGAPIRIGPWENGVTNRIVDPAAVDPKFLLRADNFIYDIVGNLTTRPPILNDDGNTAYGNDVEVLLWTLMTQSNGSIVSVVIVTSQSGTWAIVDGVRTKISNYYHPSCAEGIRGEGDTRENVIWFSGSPSDLNVGGYWTPGDSSITTIANIPVCKSMAMYDNRLWMGAIATTDPKRVSEVQFSAVFPVDADDFVSGDLTADITVGGYIQFAPEDGESVTKVVSYYDSLLVFKDSSTYLFSIDRSDIKNRSQTKRVSNTVGTPNDHTAVVFNDVVYSLHERYVHRFTGQSFVPLDEKIILTGTSGDESLSLFNDMLIARRGSNYWVYNFYTESWTTWSTARSFNWLVTRPSSKNVNEVRAIGGLIGTTNLISIESVHKAGRSESFVAELQTPYIIAEGESVFKRLFWWGAHIFHTGEVRGAVDAVSELVEGSIAWDSNSKPDNFITSPYGYFVKFLKAYRFRQIAFRLQLYTDGQQPSSIFSLISVMRGGKKLYGKPVATL